MRILIENSSNQLRNLGDVAMLQIAIERLSQLWPEAELVVITQDAGQLGELFPQVRPLLLPQPSWWKPLKHWSWSALPEALQPVVAAAELRIRSWRSDHLEGVFSAAIKRADIVIHSGAGVFADPFLPGALRRLRLLDLAVKQGKPTALFGQGIGPIQDQRLRAAAGATLPRVDLIAVREGKHSPRELEALGVQPKTIIVTGDDAVELALRASQPGESADLGVNLRFAPYSGLSRRQGRVLASLARSIAQCAGEHDLRIRPILVDPEDQYACKHLVSPSLARAAAPAHKMRTASLLNAVHQCQVVVSGSYHGAVLALAQGIPAVGLVASDYYWRKFSGLIDRFGQACALVDLRAEGYQEALVTAIGSSFGQSKSQRGPLREKARAQVRASQQAYAEFHKQIVGP